MRQSDVIKYTVEALSGHLCSAFGENGKIRVVTGNDFVYDSENNVPVIRLEMYAIEENRNYNKNERLTLKGMDEEGAEIEYQTLPSSLMDLNFIITPIAENKTEAAGLIGHIIRFMNDNPSIGFGDYAWITCENGVSFIESVNLPLERQMAVSAASGLKFSPSLFYKITVGIDSDRKDVIRRVEKRMFEFGDKIRLEKKVDR